jgi:hypothetical protein
MPANKNPIGKAHWTDPAQRGLPSGEPVLGNPRELPEEVRRFLELSPAEKIRVGERWKRELLALRGMR